MNINRQSLDDATRQGLLTSAQAEALWVFLGAREAERQHDTPGFKPAHVLYYLGGCIAIGAMSLFMTLGWERFGGWGLVAIALVYGAVALALTEFLLRKKQLRLPAGITAALAVTLVPLAVYGLQQGLGFWPADADRAGAFRDYHRLIDWRWLLMELATLAAGAVLLWRYRLPFLVMPVAVTLWYMGMDLVPFLLGGEPGQFFSSQGKWISTGFGLLMVAAAVWVDLRTRGPHDFAFWLYLFGVLSFWGGLTSMESSNEFGKFVYACINLLMIALGAALARRVFAVFGGLGVAAYLGHLSYAVFKDSLLFPVALTAIGLGLVAVGVWWQRHDQAIGASLRARLPAGLNALVARRAGA